VRRNPRNRSHHSSRAWLWVTPETCAPARGYHADANSECLSRPSDFQSTYSLPRDQMLRSARMHILEFGVAPGVSWSLLTKGRMEQV